MVPSSSRPTEKQFTLRKASSCTRRCSVRLSPIAENSSLLPPVGVWAVLNPSVADRPLRPATDRRPGEPLPHQLANRPQAPPPAPLRALLPFFVRGGAYAGLSALSRRYPSLRGRYPCVTHPSATPSACAEGVRLACVRHAASVYPEPGSNSPSKCILNLFTRLKCIVNELSPIDRVNMYSCVYYPYHSSVVQVLRLLPHLASRSRLQSLQAPVECK